ncbi:MAG: HAMP domain-containing protein, partial [Rhizobiales bacterium]|nr:HAMP domain-containing protein [Hyphomicrobiales bacterium]
MRNPRTRQALSAFSSAYAEFGSDVTNKLHKAYITSNPNETGQKHFLDYASTGTSYDAAHQEYHSAFRDFLLAKGYYDIFLFNKQGDLVYTVFKELDFATNFALNGGKWSDTDLGNSFRAGLTANADKASFFDFKPYAPSAGAPAAFISMPIFGVTGKVEGVAAFQMPIDRINSLMADKTGLGETGESAIIGTDFFLRNDSAFTQENEILTKFMKNNLVETALAGHEAYGSVGTERGRMDAFARPFEFNGVRWAILTTQAQAETQAGLTYMRNSMILSTLLLLAIVIGISLLISRSIAKPISALTQDMRTISSGNLDVSISGVERGDEIGEMASAVAVFRDNAVKIKKMDADEKIRTEQNMERTKAMACLVENLG